MRTLCRTILAAALVATCTAVAAEKVPVVAIHSATTNGVEVRWFEEMVPMKDGVRLYTYGALPPEGETRGIVFRRNPYVQEKPVDMLAYALSQRDVLKRGYAYVEQHVRGTGMSEGAWVPYEDERDDGLAMLEWLRRLPHYGGEIFLSGGSYRSSVHFSYLDTNPPDVKGAALFVQDVNRYNIAYRNGFFKIGLHGGWFVRGYRKKDKSLSRNGSVTFADFPLMGFSRRYWGESVPALDNVLTHPRPDDPFWRSHEPGSGVDYLDAINKSTMPILLRTAFYDIYTDGVCEMWRGMTPSRRANCALVIDAYDHGGNVAGWAKGTRGEFRGGSRADSSVSDLDWFDYCRTGKPVANAQPGKTRYYALWENAWKSEPELADGTRKVRLALGEGTRSWVYDPKRPLPQFPGSGGICFGGMQLQPPPNFRDDVVSFVLPPIEERLDVRGRMEMELAVSSDCDDTCFYVRVSVDKGDGKWYLLRDDITSLSFAGGEYSPGAERNNAFRFADHAFRLEKGDVLRVDVSSANSQFAPHPNVAGDAFACTCPKVAHNTVYPERSFLKLPALGAADVRDPIPAAKMPEAKHVFSMSCKVTACNGDLATAEGRAKAIAWWKKNNITKLWLESYRHGERVASERLAELRDVFRAEGFEVCGMITPTMLNDIEPGKKEPRMVVCWSDPKARNRMGEECARAAKIFDTVILDDFLFSSCGDGCARCRADKSARQIADWGEYKRTLMYEVCERDILPAVKKANPKAHFIIKYPCWYRNYANNGYSPARQAELFGECWVGTETRDANPEPLQACWIAAWMDSITHGRCGGGWYDALDCSPEKFIEQARYTILGGMKESLVHCYDYLLADDPGRTPFGEKAKSPRACAEAFEREIGNLVALAELVRGAERGKFELMPCGVSRHEFRKDGKEFTIYLNTKGEKICIPETNITLAPHELRICGGSIPRV